MRVNLCFQSLQFGVFLSFHQFCFFYLCFDKISEKPKRGANEDCCTAVKNIIKVIINKLRSFRIISDSEKSWQKPFFHKISDSHKTTRTQEKYNYLFINLISVKKLRNNYKIIYIETNDTRDEESDIKDCISGLKS